MQICFKENNLTKNKNIQFLNYNVQNKNLYLKLKKIISPESKNNVYARFFLHTLNNKQIRNFLLIAKKIIKRNGSIFIEYRQRKIKKPKNI